MMAHGGRPCEGLPALGIGTITLGWPYFVGFLSKIMRCSFGRIFHSYANWTHILRRLLNALLQKLVGKFARQITDQVSGHLGRNFVGAFVEQFD